jgi:hypothetical protein
MTGETWAAGTYLRNGKGTTLRFDPAFHDAAQLLASGFFAYDPSAPGDDFCTDTRAWSTVKPCMHEYCWMCAQAPEGFWFPLAREPRFRDRDYFYAHQHEPDVQSLVLPSHEVVAAENAARLERLKAARASGLSWKAIFEQEDAKGTA